MINFLADDNDPSSADILPHEINDIGCIAVKVFRSKDQKYPEPRIRSRTTVRVVDELPESLLKGLNVKNNTK